MKYIQQFDVKGLWGRMDLSWKNLNEDVNILVGINGCGKTTLLNLIYEYYKNEKPKKGLVAKVEGSPLDAPIAIVRSFDVPSKTKKKTESNLLCDLNGVVLQNNEGTSFFDYRMRMLNFPEKKEQIEERIGKFFALVNSLFEETGKVIEIDKNSNRLVFRLKDNQNVQIEQLSSGEKQMLLILIMVFLQDERSTVFLMDEPEISLHISWQSKLIEIIRSLNPNCQLILTTHSPSIFARGWQDKIVYMDELIVEGE